MSLFCSMRSVLEPVSERASSIQRVQMELMAPQYFITLQHTREDIAKRITL